jgi:hypothetical protein
MRTFHLTLSISIAVALLLIGTSGSLASAQTVSPAPPRMFFDDTIEQSQIATLLKPINPASSIPIGTRIVISPAIEASVLDRYLERTRTAKMAAWVAVDAPASLDTMPAWREMLRGVFTRNANAVAILEVIFHNTTADLQRFALEVAATEARARG